MVLSQSLLVITFAVLQGLPAEAFGETPELQNVLHNTHGSDAYGYPTDFTRGIMPIPVHSHNDYWRDIPFYTGISKGCISTEADVWLYNDTLYVGHDQSSLTDERTFESLYVNPMLDVLERQNPKSKFVPSPTNNGVFDTDPEQTLYFFIDVKTSGPETFTAVIAALAPLREKGYLTTLKDNKTITNAPITVIGTGNTPYDMVGPVANRDYFYDGPLAALNDGPNTEITGLISPIASTSFGSAVGQINMGGTGSVLSDEQLGIIRSQIATAKERGIGARYWGAPYYPIRARNLLWTTLLSEGVALLNADDLDAAAGLF